MTIYEYIAVNNPTQAERLIRRFGYESLRGSDLGDNLREVVAQEGEEALRAVLELHPDRDILVEVFAAKEEKESCGCSKGKCSCKPRQEYMNADGWASAAAQERTAAQVSASQTNTFLMAAALILAVAIIVKK
jgi:hypothetical protein